MGRGKIFSFHLPHFFIKRRLRSMFGREKRFIRDKNHCISKELANQPEDRVFAVVVTDYFSIATQNNYE
jgi:putative transposase